jgi:hypothetical protein
MKDGRALIVPLSWLPRLLHATDEERANWIIVGDGYGIEWPNLDEHVLVEGLFAGRRSQESDKSLSHWLESWRRPPAQESARRLAGPSVCHE